MSADSPAPLAVVRWGRTAYDDALARQTALQSARLDGLAPDTLVLTEHEPVYTLGLRAGADQHLVWDAATLARENIALHATNRGGDITYHGPGQLVAYAIFDLNRLGIGIHGHMRLLEEIVLGTLASFGIAGERDATATGVWVGPEPLRKICALGVRASRYVTMHGLALNVSPDLSHFRLIVPCGLVGRPVTSMAAELGASCPGFGAVRDELARQAQRQVNDLLDRARVAKGAD